MGYKVNDEVLIKARIKDMSYVDMMYVCELVANPDVCIRFKSPTECIVADKTYADGLNDAWELAKKIVMGVEDGGFDSQEVIDVFGKNRYYSFKDFTAEEALAKIEAHENKIKVGDVVVQRDTQKKFLVVTEEDDNSVYEFGVIDLETLMLDRICNDTKIFQKTGKHIDIESLLKQIGE